MLHKLILHCIQIINANMNVFKDIKGSEVATNTTVEAAIIG